MPPVLLKALALAKSPPAVVIESVRAPGQVVPAKSKRAPAQPTGSFLPEEVVPEYVSYSSVMPLFNACFFCRRAGLV